MSDRERLLAESLLVACAIAERHGAPLPEVTVLRKVARGGAEASEIMRGEREARVSLVPIPKCLHGNPWKQCPKCKENRK